MLLTHTHLFVLAIDIGNTFIVRKALKFLQGCTPLQSHMRSLVVEKLIVLFAFFYNEIKIVSLL